MALLTLFPIDIHIIKAHKDKITYIAELQNGNLVSSTIKGQIKIWKIKSNSYLCLKILENENNFEKEGVLNGQICQSSY